MVQVMYQILPVIAQSPYLPVSALLPCQLQQHLGGITCGINWQKTISRGITEDMDQILCTMLVLVLLGEHKNVFVCFNLLLKEHMFLKATAALSLLWVQTD